MKQYKALIRRELWENRSFTWVPIVIAAIIMLQTIAILGVAATKNQPLMHFLEHAEINIEINGHSSLTNIVSIEQYSDQIKFGVQALFATMASVFFIPLLIIIIFYFLDSLYSERQDRSILFWKSMPISDTTTVLGKLFTGAIAAPLITLAVIITVQTILLTILTPIVWWFDASAWDLLWSPANPIIFCVSLILGITLQALWWLPVYAWCLLISSWTKRSPFLFATLPIFALGLIELVSSTMIFGKTSNYVFNITGDRLSGGAFNQLIASLFHKQNHFSDETAFHIIAISAEKIGHFFTTPSVWYGLFFAIACITAAIYIRRIRNEI